MACEVVYKGNTYSEKEFWNKIIHNKVMFKSLQTALQADRFMDILEAGAVDIKAKIVEAQGDRITKKAEIVKLKSARDRLKTAASKAAKTKDIIRLQNELAKVNIDIKKLQTQTFIDDSTAYRLLAAEINYTGNINDLVKRVEGELASRDSAKAAGPVVIEAGKAVPRTHTGIIQNPNAFLTRAVTKVKRSVFLGEKRERSKHAHNSDVKRKGKVTRESSLAKKASDNLNFTMRGLGNKITDIDKLDLLSVLHGAPISRVKLRQVADIKEKKKIREVLKRQVEAMRFHIDRLTKELAASGYIVDPKESIYLDNTGKYVARVYEAKLHPKAWWNKLHDDPMLRQTLNVGLQFIYAQTKKKITHLKKQIAENPTAIKTPQFIEDVANLEDIILGGTNNPKFEAYVSGLIGVTNKEIKAVTPANPIRPSLEQFKRKGQIPKEIRELMGEIKDPIQAYQATIKRMVDFNSKYEFQKNLVKMGFGDKKGNGKLFSRVADPVNGFTERLTITRTNLPGFHDSLPTTTEIFIPPGMKEDFTVEMRSAGGLLEWVASTNSIVKWNVTVGNPMTQQRNFLSAFGFIAGNGNLFSKHGATALRTIATEVGVRGKNILINTKLSATAKNQLIEKANIRSKFMEFVVDNMRSGGSLNSSVALKEIEDFGRSGKLLSIADAVENSRKLGKFGKPMVQKSKALVNAANALYAASDDVIKIGNFMAEANRYGDIHYGKTFKQLYDTAVKTNDFSKVEKVSEIANQNTRDTVPNYGEVWRFVKQLRVIPVIGTFPSFYAEMVRSQLNIGRLMKQEWQQSLKLKKSDPEKSKKLRNAALSRLIGLAAVNGGSIVAEEIFRGVLLSVSKAFGAADEDDETATNKETDTFVRYWSPKWVKSAALIREGNGEYMYVDPSTINAHGGLNEIFKAFRKTNSDSFLANMTTALTPLFEPFLSPEIGLQAITQALGNTDAFGRKISYAEENSGEYWQDVIGYLGEKLALPGGVIQFKKYLKLQQRVINNEFKIQTEEKTMSAASTVASRHKSAKIIELLERRIRSDQKNMSAIGLGNTIGLRRIYVNINSIAVFKGHAFNSEMKSIKGQFRQKANKDRSQVVPLFEKADKRYKHLINQYKEMYDETKRDMSVDIEGSLGSTPMPKEIIKYIAGKRPTIPSLEIDEFYKLQGLPIPRKTKKRKPKKRKAGIRSGLSSGL